MTQSEYIRKIIQSRSMANRYMAATEQRTLETLVAAFDEITSILQLKSKDSVSYAHYAARRKEIARVIEQMTVEINGGIRGGIRTTADGIGGYYAKTATAYADPYGIDISQSFTQVPLNATRNVVSRVWADGQTFSDRVWKIQKQGEYGVNDIITNGIARGQSAKDMERSLRAFLVEPKLAPGARSVQWQAMRLARTEINNTYREAQVVSNQANPITLGVKWNLGSRHEVPDICDIWATADMYGLGKGIYPANKTPIDHPNGFCFLTDVLRPVSQWGQPKPGYGEADIPSLGQIEKELPTSINGIELRKAISKNIESVEGIPQRQRTT